jgi:hypothetical protein
MRRLILLFVLTVLALTFVAVSAHAASPRPVEFNLAGHTIGIDQMTIRNDFVLIRGLHAAGEVSGYFTGDFVYTENIGASYDLLKAATSGTMTITTSKGTVKVRFFGVDQLIPTSGNPIVIVVDQPWVITGGTGEYKRIHGAGTRSTFNGCGGEFCVKYTGRIF